MSHTRTRTTPVETTEPKRGAIEPEEQNSIEFSDDALLKNLPRPQPPLIAELMLSWAIQNLAEIIPEEKARPYLLAVAFEAVEQALDPKCNDAQGVELFSNFMRDTWRLLPSSISKAMGKMGDVIGLVSRHSNRDSATQRWARMKADPSLYSSLANIIASLDDDTFEFDILRLFLGILIGYWGDEAELPKLDKKIRKPHAFGCVINRLGVCGTKKGKPPPAVEEKVKKFSCDIKDADDAKNVGRMRKWLLKEYADEYADEIVDDLFEKIESEILSHVMTGLVCGLFDESPKAIVDIKVYHPWVFSASINLVERGVWF